MATVTALYQYKNLDILNNFHLYPANIFVINEIKRLMNDGKLEKA